MSLSQDIRKHVINQKIVRVELNSYFDDNGQRMYNPTIVLSNGYRVSFIVQEAYDGSDYGIEPIVIATGLGHVTEPEER